MSTLLKAASYKHDDDTLVIKMHFITNVHSTCSLGLCSFVVQQYHVFNCTVLFKMTRICVEMMWLIS